MNSSEKRKLKIVFMGSSDFAMPSLKMLHNRDDVELVAIFTKVPKPSGRGMKEKKTDSQIFGEENSIPVFMCRKITNDVVEEISDMSPDFLIVASYGLILPKSLLDVPKFCPVNIHGSLLPKLRGAAPIQFSILNGDSKTGVTLQIMNERVDEGDILLQEEISLNFSETHESLMKSLGDLGALMLAKFLSNHVEYIKNATKQNHELATFTAKIKKSAFEISFLENSADEIDRKIRAYDGNAWTIFDGIRVKLIKSLPLENEEFLEKFSDFSQEKFDESSVGKILNKDFFVKCKNGVLKLEIIKPESKNLMKGADFLRGHQKLLS